MKSVHLIWTSYWLTRERIPPTLEVERELAPSLESGCQERTKLALGGRLSRDGLFQPVRAVNLARSWTKGRDCTFNRA